MNVHTLIESVGGTVSLAERLGVSRTTVQGWKKANAIPASRAVQVMQAFDLDLTDASDLFGPPWGGAVSTEAA